VRPILFLALTLGLVSRSCADRLISIPLGRKIPFEMFKIDSFVELSHGRTWDRFLGVGLTPDIEIDYHGERRAGGPMRDTFDASYTYLTPIINQSPGISLGVQDGLNRTADGRRFYLALTFREAVDNIGNGNLPLEATIGVFMGPRTAGFVGVSIPFSDALRLLAEHDGTRISAGLEYRALKDTFGLRILTRDSEVMLGANLRLRF
jgi:hypothetical protein